jgi:hypothetical protein
MTKNRSIKMLTCVGLAAIASACSTPSEEETVQQVTLPAGAVGRIDTVTARSLPYTLREDDRQTTVDTKFVVQFGAGQITLPLAPFYGPTIAGQVGKWTVDGRGRPAKLAGSSTPGFLNRLETMPNGPISIGQTWETVLPSDAEAAAYSGIMMQTKRRFTVVEAVSTLKGPAVRVRVEGWARFYQNPSMATLTSRVGVANPQPNWSPSLSEIADVDLTTGTLLGMKIYEDVFGDAVAPSDLAAYAASYTYCIDKTSGFVPRADICGWNP